jgi:DNA-nicking Smr family endonuclease
MVKFFKNRYNILYMVIVVMLVILGFRMAVLTIVEGEEYRQIADIKKIKDIPVKAPRGKIFDRNGILLADNVSSFTVQMYTDEIKPSDFNDIAYKLSKILDENIERPIDDFPIELDTFDYIDESLEIMDSSADNTEEIEVLTYRTAEETVIERVKENIHEWLNFSTLIYGENFSPKQRVHAALLDDEVPIELKGESFEYIEDMTVPIESEENERDEDAPEIKTPIQIWLSENNLKENLSAEKAVEHLLVNNNKYLSSLFSNSKIRRLSYEFLKKEGLASNIKLNEFSFIQDEEYENIKRNLNASNEEITLSTTAKDDFVILTMKNSIDSLLKTVYKGNEKVKPGEILINRLKEIYPDLPVKFMEDGETGIFEYTDTEIRNKYFAQQHMDYSTSAYDFVKELAFKNFDVLYNLITDDDIKQYSQIELLKHVNPSISITDWEYTPIRNKINWIKNNVETAQDDGVYSAEEVFKMLRESLEISKKLGLDREIIDKAKQNMETDKIEFEDALKEIEENRIYIEEKKQEIDRLESESKKKHRDFLDKERKSLEKSEKIVDQANYEARKIIENAKKEAAEIIRELRKLHLEMDKDKNRRVNELRQVLNEKTKELSENIYSDQIAEEDTYDTETPLKRGDAVAVRSLNQKGYIISDVDDSQTVTVQIGLIKTKVKLKTSSINPKIDLRGYNLDEALLELDKYLDDAFMSNLNEVQVIHGKGTGVLREGVTQFLKNHKHVKESRLGTFNEGGDGVTIVKFK